jgi:hypothetical protein
VALLDWPGVKHSPMSKKNVAAGGSQKHFEWFQWLATQLERYSPGKTNLEMGAHQAYQNWKP